MLFKTKFFFSIVIVFVFFLNGSSSKPLSDQTIQNLYKTYTPGYRNEKKTLLSFIVSLSEKAWMGEIGWRKDWPGEAFNNRYSDKDYADTVRYILVTGGPFNFRKSDVSSQGEKEKLIHALELATDVLYREKKNIERKDFFFSSPIPSSLSAHQKQALDLANRHFKKLLHPTTALDQFRVKANNNLKKYLGLAEGKAWNNPRVYFTRTQIVENGNSSPEIWQDNIHHIYYSLWLISQVQSVEYIKKNFPDVIAILEEEGKNHFDLSFKKFVQDGPYPISMPKINRELTNTKDEILFGAVHEMKENKKVNIYNKNVYTVNIDPTQDIDLTADMSNPLHLQDISKEHFSKVYVEIVPPTAYYNQYFFKNASRILKPNGELIIPVNDIMGEPPFNINDFRAYFARYGFNIIGEKNCNFPRKKGFEKKYEVKCWVLQKIKRSNKE